jgi:sugar phosphate isomerase/epimerase
VPTDVLDVSRTLSLSAATISGVSPEATVEVAAAAGFPLVGLRPPDVCDGAGARRVRRAALRTGVRVLDVEVVRIGVTPPDGIAALVDYAATVEARHLLVVSDDPDPDATADAFAAICARSAPSGVRPVLEFMAFTAVGDLASAVAVVAAAGAAGAAGARRGAVLVDALHLARTGGTPADVAGVDAGLLPYLQVCDAPSWPPADGDLAAEARRRRLLPGHGALPLAALLRAVPGAVVSVEVQSEEGWARATPVAWATEARIAAEAVISRDVAPTPRSPER